MLKTQGFNDPTPLENSYPHLFSKTKYSVHLGGGFKYCLCSPLFWDDSYFDPILIDMFQRG